MVRKRERERSMSHDDYQSILLWRHCVSYSGEEETRGRVT